MKEIQMPPSYDHEAAKEDYSHIQNSVFEATEALVSALLPGNYTTSKLLRLSGAKVTADTLAVNVTAGWVYYDGKVYRVEPGTINPGEGNSNDNLAASYFEIQDFGQDALYQQKPLFRVYADYRLVLVVGSGIGRVALSELIDHTIQGYRGEVRDVVILSGMNVDNIFNPTTGLGINQWTGWAYANGFNGTPDLKGRARVTAGAFNATENDDENASYSTGQLFGRNKVRLTVAELPEHSHQMPARIGLVSPTGVQELADESNIKLEYNVETEKTGGNSWHENRQPSIAVVTMIKL